MKKEIRISLISVLLLIAIGTVVFFWIRSSRKNKDAILKIETEIINLKIEKDMYAESASVYRDSVKYYKKLADDALEVARKGKESIVKKKKELPVVVGTADENYAYLQSDITPLDSHKYTFSGNQVDTLCSNRLEMLILREILLEYEGYTDAIDLALYKKDQVINSLDSENQQLYKEIETDEAIIAKKDKIIKKKTRNSNTKSLLIVGGLVVAGLAVAF